jgi:ubiquinone/menaquinone biosynthesis C-methylase UbiE
VEMITVDDVTRCMSAHVPLYSWHKPIYQHVALTNLRRSWNPSHRRMLDVGGGTGVMAQMIKALFDLNHVTSVDVENRFLPSLDIETALFDGRSLPFPDGSFDCALFFNVLHHVPVTSRAMLMRECCRVTGRGPIYIKDHLSNGVLDDARLSILDVLGNVPFHGMISARYLRGEDWHALARAIHYDPGEYLSGTYRTGCFESLFPNRLETSMRWCPA